MTIISNHSQLCSHSDVHTHLYSQILSHLLNFVICLFIFAGGAGFLQCEDEGKTLQEDIEAFV